MFEDLAEVLGAAAGAARHPEVEQRGANALDIAKIQAFRTAFYEPACDFVPGDLVTWKSERTRDCILPVLGGACVVMRVLPPELGIRATGDKFSGSPLEARIKNVFCAVRITKDGEPVIYAFESWRMRKMTEAEIANIPVGEIDGTDAQVVANNLLRTRQILREAREFEQADQIRDQVIHMGFTVRDHKDGTSEAKPNLTGQIEQADE